MLKEYVFPVFAISKKQRERHRRRYNSSSLTRKLKIRRDWKTGIKGVVFRHNPRK